MDHFRSCWELCQEDSQAVSLDKVSESLFYPSISKEPPSLSEVRASISKLKNVKAADICILPSQVNSIPLDLLRIMVIPFWKVRGDRWDCSNYHSITFF